MQAYTLCPTVLEHLDTFPVEGGITDINWYVYKLSVSTPGHGLINHPLYISKSSVAHVCFYFFFSVYLN